MRFFFFLQKHKKHKKDKKAKKDKKEKKKKHHKTEVEEKENGEVDQSETTAQEADIPVSYMKVTSSFLAEFFVLFLPNFVHQPLCED